MTRSYADLPDEYFEQYVVTYRELCSKTLRMWGTFYIGMLGQVIALTSLFEALTGRRLIWLVTAIAFLPFLIYMGLVFIKVPPPITPHAYRQVLLLVICWFSMNSVISIAARFSGHARHAGVRCL